MATPGRQPPGHRGSPTGSTRHQGRAPCPLGSTLVCSHGPTAKVGTGSLQQVKYTSYDKRCCTAILVIGGSAVPGWHGSVGQRSTASRYRSWSTYRTLRSVVRSPLGRCMPGFLVDHAEVRAVCVCENVWYGSLWASGPTPRYCHQGARTWHVGGAHRRHVAVLL